MEQNTPRKAALIANCLLNQNAKVCECARYRGLVSPDVEALRSRGYLLLQLPSGEHRLLLAVIADQLAEYAHRGYAVVAIGMRGEPGNGLHWRRLAPLVSSQFADPTARDPQMPKKVCHVEM